MKTLFSLLTLVFLLSGCSTFWNPFRSNQAEDYNALTYGDEYRDTDPSQRSNWGPYRVKVENKNGPNRSVAGEVASADSQQPETGVLNRGPLDPSDQRVRDQIAVARGQAVDFYKRGDRATRADFIDEQPNDGSLWSNEVDANYFFTKEKMRALGDIISVKVEDPLIKQVAEEVKKGLSPAEQEVEMALYLKNSPAAKADKDIEAYRAIASDDLRSSDAANVKDMMQKAVRWSQVDLSPALGLAPNDEIRAEVVEKYSNGNYKIRAIRRVLYRGTSRVVSLVGVAPANDFDEKDTIPSGKLYEYKVNVGR